MIEQILKDGVPDGERRGCTDCKHMQAAVTWWCTSPKAVRRRRTTTPNVIGCQDWEPCRTYAELGFWERLLGRNHVVVK